MHRARLQVSANNLVAAREDYESALALNPESVDTIYALALLNTQAGNHPAAEKYFNRLEGREFSGQGMVAYQLGLFAQDRGDIETAQHHFQSVRDGEYYVDARGQLALLLSRQGKNEEARKMLTETSVKSVADRSRLAVAEARILRDSKQFDAAFAVLEKALLAEPNEPVLLYDTAMLAEQLKKQDVVETTLTRLIELQPNHPHAYNALGYSWADRNVRLQEARLLIARALELAPQDPAILDSMGWVLFRLGQPEAALVHLEKAHGLLSDPEIAAHLGEVLWVIGRRDEALRVWSDARLRYPASEVLGAVIDRFRP